MGFSINLLQEPAPGRAWIKMVLDLDPTSFKAHHARALRQGTADYLGIDPAEIRVLGISRWKPIVQLELPAGGAERVVRAFESRDAMWRRSLEPLAFESVRLDPPVWPSTTPPEATAGAPASYVRRLAGAAASAAVAGALFGVLAWLMPAEPGGEHAGGTPVLSAPGAIERADRGPRRLASVRLPLRATESVASVTFQDDDRQIAVTSEEGSVFVVPVDNALQGDEVDRRQLRLPTAGEGFDSRQTTHLVHFPGGGKAASVRRDGTVRIHYPGELPTELRRPHGRLVRALWSPSGDRLLTFSEDRRIEIWSTFVRSGRQAVWSGDGRRFAFTVYRSLPSGATGATGAEAAERVEVWNVDGPQKLLSLPGRRPHFSRDGSRLLTVARDGFRIWDDSGRSQATLAVGTLDHRRASAVRFSPDGAHVAALFRRRATVWVLRTDGGQAVELPLVSAAAAGRPGGGQTEQRPGGGQPERTTAALAWSGDGRRLAAIRRGQVRLWNTGDWNQPRILPRHADHLEWTTDGSRLLTYRGGGSDDGVWLWSGDGHGEGVQLIDRSVQSAAWSPDGRWLAVVYLSEESRGPEAVEVELLPVDGLSTVPRFRREGRQPRALPRWPKDVPFAPLRGGPGSPMLAVFSAGGSRLLTVGRPGPGPRAVTDVRVWRTGDSWEMHALPRHTRSLYGASISADGRWVLTEDANRGVRSIRLWRADSPLVLEAAGGGLEAAAWSPDGRFVATVTAAGDVQVWPATHPGRPTPVCRDSSLAAPVWSPDGRRLVTFAGDGTFFAQPWSGSGQRLRFAGHSAPMTHAAWSPDGRFLLSTSRDGTARIWSGETAAAITVLADHRGAVAAGAWSADGRRIATVDDIGTLVLWPNPAAAR